MKNLIIGNLVGFCSKKLLRLLTSLILIKQITSSLDCVAYVLLHNTYTRTIHLFKVGLYFVLFT